MPRLAAGILLYRSAKRGLEVLLAHPGGPFYERRDRGVWSIPKGEPGDGEELLAAAHREFEEETGFRVAGAELALGTVKQQGGKIVHAWAVRGDVDPSELRSNHFELEWPRGSGKLRSFPEVDRAEWFALDEARRRIKPAQAAFLDELERLLARQ